MTRSAGLSGEERSMIPDDDLMPDINGRDIPPYEDGKARNILRDRTFNQDLRNILQKIRDNETPGDGRSLTIEDISGLTDEEFIVALHALFYKIKNAGDIGAHSFDFDPFDGADGADYAGPVHWGRLLDEKMISSGFREYALLRYDFGLRAFRPRLGSMNMEMHNIAVSLRDGLFDKIRVAEHGIFLHSSDIEVDDWLSKLFRPTDGKDYALYCVRSGALTAGLFDSFLAQQEAPTFPLDDGILVVRFIDTADLPGPQELHARLESEIALVLALSIETRVPDFRALGLDEIDTQLALVEYLLFQYSYYPDGMFAVISVNKFREKEFFFIMKYLIAKLKKGLRRYSSIVQISGTCILLLGLQSDTAFINETIAEINRYYNDVVQITFFDRTAVHDSGQLFHRLFMR